MLPGATTVIATEQGQQSSERGRNARAALVADARVAVRRWARARPGPIHRAAADAALAKANTVGNSEAIRFLAQVIFEACAGLAAVIVTPAALVLDGDLLVSSNMLELDANLANWTASYDINRAQRIRAGALQRLVQYRQGGEQNHPALFKFWIEDGAIALANAALTLWLSPDVQARWQRTLRVRPALVRAVAGDVLPAAMTQVARLGADDGRVFDRAGREVGRFDVASMEATAIERVRSGLDLFGTVAAHRLVRTLVHTVHDQWESGKDDARAVEFVGGWQALAEAIRDKDGNHERLRAILDVGQKVIWTHPEVTVGGLWTWTDKRGGNGWPGRVRIIVGDALAPSLAARLASGGNTAIHATKARRLVPELRAEPPVGSVRPNDQGAAWMLHRLALIELVDAAVSLVHYGSVAIKPERWRELAERAGLPRTALPALLASWFVGESVIAPALLSEPEPGRFTLAQPHSAELDFIAAGGRARIAGKANARKGKENKAVH